MLLDGHAHNLNCTSQLASMHYDPTCTRCSKIKKVVFLRRKTVANGATSQEESTALEQADRIRETFKLTRGEIFDRQFEVVPTLVEQKETFKAAPTKAARKTKIHSTFVTELG